LQLLDEPPEGPPVSPPSSPPEDGGASGSGGPLAPIEAVPELPPVPPPASPPEGDQPEGAPSKGEEVKQQLAEAPARFETEAYVALEAEFIAVAKPEDLREADLNIYEAVKGSGAGVCSRCRWLSGCQSCDEEKAWGFACRSTLWHTASEAVRPKAKPRGRPKKS